MSQPHDPFGTLADVSRERGRRTRSTRSPRSAKAGLGVSRLPVSIRLVLESLLRNCDGKRVTEHAVRRSRPLEGRRRRAPRRSRSSSPGSCSRTSRASRSSSTWPRCARPRPGMGRNPKMIEPLVPVDLVVDHSVQVDFSGSAEALGQEPRDRVHAEPRALPVPQVGHAGLRHLQGRAPGDRHRPPGQPRVPREGRPRRRRSGVCYPDTLVGTDSHTTMINGLGIVGWGVGGIEAEAGMLGQPVYFLTPDVVGVHLTGVAARGRDGDRPRADGHPAPAEGQGGRASSSSSTAPARRRCRSWTARRSATWRPEYGATMGFFPIDSECSSYLRATGRSAEHVAALRGLLPGPGALGHPEEGPDRLFAGHRARPRLGRPERRRPEAARRTGSSCRGSSRSSSSSFSRPVAENGFGRKAEDYAAAGADVPLNGGGAGEDRPRQRPDRRDHQLHEHLQPVGHAGRRAPGEEGGGARAHGRAAPSSRRSRPGSRVVTDYLTRRGSSPTSTRSASRRSATGARPASATPGPSRRRDRGRGRQERPRRRLRPLGQPQLRGARPPEHQGQFPHVAAAGRRLRPCRPGRHRPDPRAAGPGKRREGRLPERPLADPGGGQRA